MKRIFLAVASVMIATLTIAGLGGTALAQMTVDEERRATGPDLDAVVVSASRIAESLREVSQSVQVITADDIERSGANEIVDVLKKLGIRTFMEGSDTYGNNGITMRGGRTSMHGFDLGGDILILVDGRRSASDFGSEFELGNVERIEVVRGPGAVQFGSAALAGVINIITKRGGLVPKAKIEAGMGSWGESKYLASGSGRFGKFDISAAVSHRTRDSYQIPDGTVQENSDLDGRTGYSMNIGYNIDELNRVGIVFHGSDTSSAGKGPNEASRPGTGVNNYNQTRQSRDSYAFDLLYEGKNQSETMSWLVRYFRGESKYDISRYYYNHTPPGREIFSKSENVFDGAQVQYSWKRGPFQMVTGVDWLKYDYAQIQLVSYPTESYSTIENVGAFLILKYRLLSDESLILSGGVRYDDFDVDVRSRATNGAHRTVSTSMDKINPSLGITYNPTQFLKLRSSYGAAYKMPLPRQLGGFTYMAQYPYVGNPELKPEESVNWEVGFDIEHRGLFFSATYFNTKMKNAIVSRRINPGDPGYINGVSGGYINWWYNADSATIRGIETGGSFDLGEFFDWQFRLEPYFYWTRLFRFHNDDTGEQLSDRGRDSASFGVVFSYPSIKLTASLDGVRNGNMDSGGTHLEDSTVWDFSLKKALFSSESYGDVNIKLTVKNMLNEDYQTTDDDVMPGRSFYVALEYNY
jgi:vitamin B12 transporter